MSVLLRRLPLHTACQPSASGYERGREPERAGVVPVVSADVDAPQTWRQTLDRISVARRGAAHVRLSSAHLNRLGRVFLAPYRPRRSSPTGCRNSDMCGEI